MRAFQSLLINSVLIPALGLGACKTFADAVVPNHPLLSDRYIFKLGGFYSRSTTEASVAPSSGGAGRGIDFENALGLSEREAVPTFGFTWRIGDRWQAQAEHFTLRRSATHRLNADTQWGDTTYPAGSEIDSRFNVTDTRISAGYSFFRTADKELGAGLGIHVFELETNLSTSITSAKGRRVTAPLPVINLYGNFALTDTWAIGMRADWLSLDNGNVSDVSIDMYYQPWRNLGLGFGMRNLSINLNTNSSDWDGEARLNFQGPTAFVSASF